MQLNGYGPYLQHVRRNATEMNETVKSELEQLELKFDIKILLAVESGSRAWGFSSKDSDWDVRFIYIHKPEWYLSIDDKKDNIEVMLPGDLDFAGWELRKTLKLFRKSNPPLLEWLQSPILYLEQFSAAQRMRILTTQYFNPKSCMYHYLRMAKGNLKNYLQHDLVRTKKYFYALRPIFACRWIEKYNEMAPMEFKVLMDNLDLTGIVQLEIENLLARKKDGEELDKEPQNKVLNDYLAKEIAHFENYIKVLNPEKEPLTAKLNLLFRNALDEAWVR